MIKKILLAFLALTVVSQAETLKYWNGDKKFTQEVTAGNGVRSQRPARLYYGLGDCASVDSIVVTWTGEIPDYEKFEVAEINKTITLTQGEGVPAKVESGVVSGLSLSVNPNPVSDIVNLEIKSGEVYTETAVNIYNSLGETVRQKLGVSLQRGKNVYRMDVSDLAPGVYYIMLDSGDEKIGKRFVKM